MASCLSDPRVRTKYLKVLRQTANMTAAAAAAGIGTSSARHYYDTTPAFAAACDEAIEGRRPVMRPVRRWSAARRTDFLEALARTGSPQAAALQTGSGESGAYGLKRIDADFAAAWAQARAEAFDRVDGMLFDGALNGYTTITTKGDTTTTTVVQRPDIMLRLLARRPAGGTNGVRVVELTPEIVAAARSKLMRQLRLAASGALIEGEPLVPALAALPSPATAE